MVSSVMRGLPCSTTTCTTTTWPFTKKQRASCPFICFSDSTFGSDYHSHETRDRVWIFCKNAFVIFCRRYWGSFQRRRSGQQPLKKLKMIRSVLHCKKYWACKKCMVLAISGLKTFFGTPQNLFSFIYKIFILTKKESSLTTIPLLEAKKEEM